MMREFAEFDRSMSSRRVGEGWLASACASRGRRVRQARPGGCGPGARRQSALAMRPRGVGVRKIARELRDGVAANPGRIIDGREAKALLVLNLGTRRARNFRPSSA